MTTTGEKRCTICQQLKQPDQFHWGGKNKTKRNSACKVCSNKKRNEADKLERIAAKQAREEAALHIAHAVCRVCTIAMLPEGDVDNQPWADDETMCESCGRKGLLGGR